MNRVDIHKQVIDHYRWENQIHKFIEELGELRYELIVYLKTKQNLDKVINEFGDVLNTIEQFEIIAKERKMFTHLDVDKVQNFKMNRELERINNTEV